jgi:hypothetical protein
VALSHERVARGLRPLAPPIEQHRTMRAARLLVAIGIGRVGRWNTVDSVTPLCGGNASSTPPTSVAWSR